MLLVIDAGNTNIVFAVRDDTGWIGSWRIRTDPRRRGRIVEVVGRPRPRPHIGDIPKLARERGSESAGRACEGDAHQSAAVEVARRSAYWRA